MNRRIPVIIAVLLFMPCIPVVAAPGDSAAAFLRIGVGAKPSSLGEAYAGASGDILSMYYNPAGLAELFGYELSFSHTFWIEGINYINFIGGAPFLGGYAALGLSGLSVGEIEKYTTDGSAVGETYNPTDMALTAAYARMLDDFSAGGALKITTSEIDGDRANAFAIDLGAMRCFGLLNTGISFQNIGIAKGFRDEYYAMPLNLRIGASYPFQVGELDFLALAETSFSTEVPFKLNAGVNADYVLNGIILSFRLGVKSYARGLNALSHLTTGLGIFYDDVGLDYAFASYEDLGMTHRISLGYKFY